MSFSVLPLLWHQMQLPIAKDQLCCFKVSNWRVNSIYLIVKKNYKNSELNSIWPTFSKRSLWCGLRSERNYPRNVIKQQYPARTQREWTFSGGGARFPWKTSKFCLFADLAHCWNFKSNKNNWKSNVLTLKTRVTAWSTVIQLVLDSNVLEEYCFGFFCCDL